MLRTSSTLIFRCALTAASLIGAAQAADIYQWVDASGRVHVSDVVPEKYRAIAKRMDSQRFELTPAQKAEAQARQARRANSSAAASASAASEEQPGANQGNDAKSAPAASLSGPAKKAAPPPPDCQALWQAYADSQACFAPFQNVNGTMKPGANEACTELPDPSPRCGLPKLP